MSLIRLFSSSLVLAAWLFGGAVNAETGPNVIIVMTDDQGYSDLGCHGHPIVETPHLDKLSSQSVRFTDFHVDPYCAPTRAALMTGRMSNRTGTTSTHGLRNLLRQEETLMPEYFKASGYKTAIFGKWHLGGNYPYRPMDRGFDEWLGLGNGGLGIADDLWDNDRMNDRFWHNCVVVSRSGFSTDVYFDSAMAFMQSCKSKAKPFFTYLATNVPHEDNNVPAQWLKPYLAKGCSREQAGFYAGISRIDWNMGRLLEFLDAQELSDNTILIFMTDNGSVSPVYQPNTTIDSVSGNRGKKNDVYDGGHRVPCFIKGPEKLLGLPKDITALTAHVDLLPSLIDLCKLQIPDRACLPLDGMSLNVLLKGQKAGGDRTLFLHHRNGPKGLIKSTKGVVMTAQWRLILNQLGDYELYQIKEDPSQLQDLSAQHPEVVGTLLAEYEGFWNSLGHERALERPQLSKHATIKLTSGWQRDIRKGSGASGKWSLKVAESGTYRFEVRRWPREAGSVAMTDGLSPAHDPEIEYIGARLLDVPGKALKVKAADLQITGQAALSKELVAGAGAVTFDLELRVGEVDLLARLVLADGKKRGANYVYVTKLP